MTITTDRRYTVEEFLRLPLEGRWELIDGIPIEKDPIEPRAGSVHMGNAANEVTGNLYVILRAQLQNPGIGRVILDCWIRGFGPGRTELRRPDVAFFAAGRLPPGRAPDVASVMPTLAVESISPGNTVDEIDAKLIDYHEAGVPLVWVLSPLTKRMRTHYANRTIREYREGDTFADEPLLPGLTFRVAELFAMPGQTPA